MAVKGYTGTQIGLHWIIAVLIGVQFLYHQGMKSAWRLLREGREVPVDLGTTFHVLIGILVLLLVLPRLGLRLTRGAPPQPENEAPAAARIARITHIALYAIILALPLSGLLAWFGHVGAAAIGHSVLGKLLLLFVALHVLGALYQTVAVRSGALWRMFRATD